MKLNSKVSHQIWVFNAFKYFQLICSLLDCFVIIRLEPDLVETKIVFILFVVVIILKNAELILLKIIPLSWPLVLQCQH